MKVPRTLIFFLGIFLGLQVLWIVQPRVKCSDNLQEFTGKGKISCQEGSNIEIVTINDKVYFSCHCPAQEKPQNAEFIRTGTR